MRRMPALPVFQFLETGSRGPFESRAVGNSADEAPHHKVGATSRNGLNLP